MEPIAKRLRQSAESALLPPRTAKPTTGGRAAEDVAERIRRLEAELQQSNGSSDSSDGSASGDSDSDSDADGSDASDGKDAGVVSLSAFAGDRVEALPAQQLPPRGQKRTQEAAAASGRPELLDAVEWPARVPFACKPCGFVGADMDELRAHWRSAAHLARSTQELRCALCDKTFTSPSQLAEHRAGKWHQQRLQRRTERHVVRVCYDFVRGSCARGDRCAFQHTETKAMRRGETLDRQRRRACDAFARTGRCRFGDKCLFSHASGA